RSAAEVGGGAAALPSAARSTTATTVPSTSLHLRGMGRGVYGPRALPLWRMQRTGTLRPMSAPKEIAPGLYHWTSMHPVIKIRVHSYYAAREKVLLDPLLPSPGGLAWLKRHGPPEHVVLTNRLHSRHSAKL